LRPRSGKFGDSGWVWITALAFVVLTLAALIVVPLLVQRRVDAARVEIEASEPARTLLMRVQYNLVRELASINDFLRSGDREFAGMFIQARDEERQIFAELAPLAADLGLAVHGSFVEARTLAEQWHAQIRDDEILRSPRTARSPPQDSSPVLFEVLLQSFARLDSAIIRRTAASRAEIAAAERAGLELTLLLGLLALAAALAVSALVVRVRRLATESERRRLEAASALEESARASEARNRLLRGVTHDVKNPLGAAKGYAELLDLGIKGELLPEQHSLVKGVQRSVDSALAIISDLLDLARTDSGGMSVRRVSIDLNEIVNDAVEDNRAAAETAGHVLSTQTPAQPVYVYTDPVRVRQVLDNLISNAIKYTAAPGRLSVSVVARAHDAPRVARALAIHVKDNGPGIPQEKREMIFDEFTRLDDESSTHGHGLGLAIARRIARILGGDLGVLDDDGQPGATFAFWLPERS
jgi:signal transduction histidine kinase